MSNGVNGRKVFVSGAWNVKKYLMEAGNTPYYMLDTFFDLRSKSNKVQEYMDWVMKSKMFMLDSGAYSIRKDPKKVQDLDDYVDKYIEFINKYNIEYFFELDLDSVIGYEKVLEYRKKIEDGTGKKVIPVWHTTRSIEEFYKSCDQYKIVAIGGVANRSENVLGYDDMVEMCNYAHQKGCIIHGLGYVQTKLLDSGTMPFDTVDSSAWQAYRWGKCYMIDDDTGKLTLFRRPYSKEEIPWIINECFNVWKKYQKIIENKEPVI